MLTTWLIREVGVNYPIIQGVMGPYSTNKLCAAVARTGGLGIISLIGMGVQHSKATPVDPAVVFGEGPTEEYLERSLEFVKTETRATGGVFGVNCPLSMDFLEAAGRIDDLPTVKELIERIAEDAERIIKNLPERFIC